MYVNGDPVNFHDPTGHNPCANDDCPPAVNTQLAAGSRPGIGLPPAAVPQPPAPSAAAPPSSPAATGDPNDLRPTYHPAAFDDSYGQRPVPTIIGPDRHVADINGALAPDLTLTFGQLAKLCNGEVMGLIEPMKCAYVQATGSLDFQSLQQLCHSLGFRRCRQQGTTDYVSIDTAESAAKVCLSSCNDFVPHNLLLNGLDALEGATAADAIAASEATGPAADVILSLADSEVGAFSRTTNSFGQAAPEGEGYTYGAFKHANALGNMAGSRSVRTIDLSTGDTIGWQYETYDAFGNVRIIRPQWDGPGPHFYYDANGDFTGTG